MEKAYIYLSETRLCPIVFFLLAIFPAKLPKSNGKLTSVMKFSESGYQFNALELTAN